MSLDLCAVCVSTLWPSMKTVRQQHPAYSYYSSFAVHVDGRPARWGALPTVEELEAGATVDIPGGVTLTMRAVTTVAGTRMCQRHASEGMDQIEQRTVYR